MQPLLSVAVATVASCILICTPTGAIAQGGTAGQKIEHFVMLLMENRPTDHIFGCMIGEGIIDGDGIDKVRHIRKSSLLPELGNASVTCGTANYVCRHNPTNNLFSLQLKPLSDHGKYPYGPMSDDYSFENGASGNAIEMFSSEQLPIKTAVAKHFAIFNNLHGAVPSYSTPNHLMTHSGTSCGLDDNLNWKECGGNQSTFPQPTIYDSLAHDNVTFKMYTNSTSGSCPDGELDGIGRHKEHCKSQSEFYKDAAAGTLPSFSYLSPPGEACDHPCHDIAKGERLIKDIYEALRAGPGWEKTMFFVAYDDGGGFYDHVIPPHEGVPNPESPCQIREGCTKPFDFRRLGIRVTSFIMSPWIPKNLAIGPPRKGPYASSQFDLTSGIATVKKIFNLTTFLTKRDAWAGTFDELLTLDTPRTDCPLHFPEGPNVSSPWTCPGCQNTESELASIARRRLEAEGAPEAQHCSAKRRVCEGTAAVTQRQRRAMRTLAHAHGIDPPAETSLDFSKADSWIETHSAKWMEMPAKPKLSRDEFLRWTEVARR